MGAICLPVITYDYYEGSSFVRMIIEAKTASNTSANAFSVIILAITMRWSKWRASKSSAAYAPPIWSWPSGLQEIFAILPRGSSARKRAWSLRASPISGWPLFGRTHGIVLKGLPALAARATGTIGCAFSHRHFCRRRGPRDLYASLTGDSKRRIVFESPCDFDLAAAPGLEPQQSEKTDTQ